MSVYNEYDKLQTVLIGKVLDPKILKKYKHMASPFGKMHIEDYNADINWDHLSRLHNETNEDLDNLQKFLENKGITVYRPNIDVADEIFNKYGINSGPTSVRDWLFSYGDTLIATETSWLERKHEHLYWEDAFSDLKRKGKNIEYIKADDTHEFNEEGLHSIWHERFTNYSPDNAHILLQEWLDIVNTYSDKDLITYKKWANNVKKHTLNHLDHIGINSWKLYTDPYIAKYNFFHAASAFKHDDYLISGPMGTVNGYAKFIKILKKINPNLKEILVPYSCHIDAFMNIINKNEIWAKWNIENLDFMTNHGYDEHHNKNHSMLDYDSHPLTKDTYYKNVHHFLQKTNSDDVLGIYFKILRGYEQRGDFEYNALTIAPNEFVGTIFDSKVKAILNKKNIIAHNVPLRHRNLLDGGIHCYTLDIDREN